MSHRVLAHAALFALVAVLVMSAPVPVLILWAVPSLPLVAFLEAGVPAKSRRTQ